MQKSWFSYLSFPFCSTPYSAPLNTSKLTFTWQLVTTQRQNKQLEEIRDNIWQQRKFCSLCCKYRNISASERKCSYSCDTVIVNLPIKRRKTTKLWRCLVKDTIGHHTAKISPMSVLVWNIWYLCWISCFGWVILYDYEP